MKRLDKIQAWLKQTVEKNGFFHGIFFALAFSSALAIAVTGIEGFHTFSPGGVISASQMNENFEKVAGEVIFHGRNLATFSHLKSSAGQQCGYSADPCHLGFLVFDEVVGGGDNYLSVSDPSTSTYSFTSGSTIKYIKIPVSGFYEIRLVAHPSTFTIDVGAPSASVTVDCMSDIYKFDESAAATQLVLQNNEYDIRLGGYMPPTLVKTNISKNGYDGDANGILSMSELSNGSVNYGTLIRKYFAAGETFIPYMRTLISASSTSASGAVYNAGELELIIKRIP
ncbi:MAG: hypothetical protein A2X86_20280 [Bdellovibrionales bacterium GWA2_49_15]|nr:MAG: hypothetical protein A2X86_20280 [Bdellovibrionales bacterium GWA2_49_15]HAZ11349.1 hypothetical protein [Bdellovibrionales bacterium]